MRNLSNDGGESGTTADRVRRATAADVNAEIDRQIDRNIRYYRGAAREAFRRRIDELDREWDIERVLEVQASSLALTGLLLGTTGIEDGSPCLRLSCHSFFNTGCKGRASRYLYSAASAFARGTKSTGKNTRSRSP